MSAEDDAETIEYIEEILEAIAEAVGVDAEIRVEDSGTGSRPSSSVTTSRC